MNRAEKQRRLAQAAAALSFSIEHGNKAFFGNEGVTIYKNGTTGDIVGRLFVDASLKLPKLKSDVTDPKEALALVLGVDVSDLPVRIQTATNELAIAADDTKRSYARRVPRLVKLLGVFATEIVQPFVAGSTIPALPPAQKFSVPGKSL